jgi:hypothetical protein
MCVINKYKSNISLLEFMAKITVSPILWYWHVWITTRSVQAVLLLTGKTEKTVNNRNQITGYPVAVIGYNILKNQLITG